MRSLKLIFGVLACSLITIVACEKEQVLQEAPATKTSVFKHAESSDQSIRKEAAQMLFLVDNKTVTTPVADQCNSDPMSASAYCCLVRELNYAPAPWDPTLVNLNVKYCVSRTNQEVRVFHFREKTYVGYDAIGSSYTTCTSKSINLSTGQLAPGNYTSVARIWNGTEYCGGQQVLHWTKP